MSQVRAASSYAMAGFQNGSGEYFGVKNHVYVPDGDAGTEHSACYRIPRAKEMNREKKAATIPFRVALVCWALVFAFCCVLVLTRKSTISNVTKSTSAMLTSMENTRRDNVQLALEVEQARDASRICYLAVNDLGMIAASGDAMAYIYVYEIDEFLAKTHTQTVYGELPSPEGHATLTGSR